ncbi:hypothetical protein TWF225_001205 [Orbilia oligospora]|uniref:Uncharacterized protein n=1 Tax=Orbilia oligospora TaxID=2813651 RepID=A0A7C8KAX3_ORBOL|nr:hypothetical protein TWF225_001205 [Orbilia oligospora]KAF3166335.1 hypothetical protein TWF751_008722 [Orbilia oligospora]KAF3234676.1 hypothetical protein TWF128_002247 [Orbilia oligospora]KAF3269337.1 hypothetical protein TWF217_009420 [Orbilia oligospora]KAF3291594.1 hypothetical protein TWF132_006588 [Orbilia oligospora]
MSFQQPRNCGSVSYKATNSVDLTTGLYLARLSSPIEDKGDICYSTPESMPLWLVADVFGIERHILITTSSQTTGA